ncbi:Alpha/Beta hydrolase protein, partial [Hyaloscypha finlandica]
IIAVHGLSGGAASTWTHPANQTLWLRDLLPNIVQDLDNLTSARIWTFGYNANIIFSPAVAGISDFTRSLLGYLEGNGINTGVTRDIEQRKVIFIAHSLGGVVVKSALIDAGRHGSQHRWLLDATVGIVFLGTPHQGSRIADRGAYVAKIAKYSGLVTPNRKILESLSRNSGELFDKAEQFRDVCTGIQLCSFYENMPLSGARQVVIVDRNSAFIGVNGEEFTPLDADHRSICKMESPKDQKLSLVKNSIIKM